MELIGKLKQKAENAAGKEEVRELIEQASVEKTNRKFYTFCINTPSPP